MEVYMRVTKALDVPLAKYTLDVDILTSCGEQVEQAAIEDLAERHGLDRDSLDACDYRGWNSQGLDDIYQK
jgi:hypothetical protein